MVTAALQASNGTLARAARFATVPIRTKPSSSIAASIVIQTIRVWSVCSQIELSRIFVKSLLYIDLPFQLALHPARGNEGRLLASDVLHICHRCGNSDTLARWGEFDFFEKSCNAGSVTVHYSVAVGIVDLQGKKEVVALERGPEGVAGGGVAEPVLLADDLHTDAVEDAVPATGIASGIADGDAPVGNFGAGNAFGRVSSCAKDLLVPAEEEGGVRATAVGREARVVEDLEVGRGTHSFL